MKTEEQNFSTSETKIFKKGDKVEIEFVGDISSAFSYAIIDVEEVSFEELRFFYQKTSPSRLTVKNISLLPNETSLSEVLVTQITPLVLNTVQGLLQS